MMDVFSFATFSIMRLIILVYLYSSYLDVPTSIHFMLYFQIALVVYIHTINEYTLYVLKLV